MPCEKSSIRKKFPNAEKKAKCSECWIPIRLESGKKSVKEVPRLELIAFESKIKLTLLDLFW